MKIQKKCEEYKYKIFQIQYNPYQKKKNEESNILEEEKKCYFLMPFTFCGCLFSLKKEDNLMGFKTKKIMLETELNNSMESGKKLDKFAGCIFVTFNTVKDKEQYFNIYPHYFIEKVFHFIKNLKYYLCCLMDEKKTKKFKMNKKINVSYANEPEDIIWENMEYSLSERIIRSLLIYLISLFLLLILLIIVFELTSLQDSLNENKHWKFITINLVSYSIALVILIVNKLFQLLLEFLTELEKPISFSNFYLSCSVKLTVFAFITSSIIPFTCNAFKKEEDKDNNLMIKNITNLFIVNAIVLPLPTPLIFYYFKKFRIWLIKRKPYEHYKTQRELNELFELPDMNISYKYSDVCQTILMTFFYIPIFPLGAVFSSIGLIFTFFGQKFYFIHFYKRPEMLNESICKFYLEYFILDILIYAIGDYIFTYKLYDKRTWSLFNLIFFVILAIIPFNKLILLYLDKKKIIQINSTPISKVYFTFYNDYERQNPITKKEGLCKYINTLREKKYISERVKEIATNNVENINIMEVYYRTSIRRSLMKSHFTFVNNHIFQSNLSQIESEIFDEDINRNTQKINYPENELNFKEEENKNNINEIKKDNAIIEEDYLKQILRNNNSLMLESFRNPFLLGINDSIRLSLNERRNSNWHKDLVLNDNIVPNYSKNDNNNLLNLPKFQINNGNVK